MKKKIILYLIIAIIATLILLIPNTYNENKSEGAGADLVNGEVTTVSEIQDSMQSLEVQLEDGKLVSFENDESYSVSPRIFYPGDKIVMAKYQEDTGLNSYYVTDYQRTDALIILFFCFVLAVLVVARMQGVGSIFGMLFSFLVLFKIVLPQILSGTNPVFAAIIGAILIIPVAFYLSHGFNRKTHVAILGTVLTLILTGFLAEFFANLASLTGLSSEEAGFLKIETSSNINFGGIILAGMIISILGILDDITISQSSIVNQLKGANKKISFQELFSRSMAVGRDHISSLVNTLVLVYTGASLPLLLLFLDHSQPFMQVINLEFIAEEIVLTLVGSIGLIVAVPITTVIACVLADGKGKASHCHH
jgi:uncharacterized membrane protein